ncbi:alpha/beta fold hydrolase [Belnapia sp. T6]|uniref:Alpha/beta fold hydrolase n=1 Tax=Belnapia mucosa TaxID=2804532 RepID=A0ABS1V9A0_9PROT|nr:alpha/beta fold hydrolase [Belnapia mucosa]MBL6458235.1 alpha/beta fold hydrolase [Belnapia mucosa]
MLTIRMLGALAVLRDGVEQPLPPSKKTRALLGYLVATGRPQRRERLCTLLWDVPDDPRGALRWSLSKLRGLVDEPNGPARILAERDTVGYAPEGAQSDLFVLRQVCAQPLARAATGTLTNIAASIGGEFLAGLDLPAQPDFQAWCLAEREDTRRQHAAVLEELVNRFSAAAPEEAVGHARRWVELDGFEAKSRAALVGLLVRLGRRAEAEQHCETGLRLLQEGGMPPGPLMAAARELRRRPSPAAPVQAVAGPAPTGTAAPAGGARRLIIVDDEPEIGWMVAEYLGRHGFAVRTATNGRALRQLLAEEPADLVILDVNMPGEDGFAVARSLGVGADGPRILFLTAAIDVVDRVVGLELGAEDYITKPFDLRELRARVRNVLRRVEEAAGESKSSPAPHEPEVEPTPVLRQEIRFCLAADRVRIAYATSGEGPPLLKPSNWLTHLEFDWESPVWRHWMRELSRGRRLIRYDARGNGLSDWQVEDLSLTASRRDMEAVVEAAGLERFAVLGISQGCATAIAYAAEHPGRVSHLVLYGGYARGWAQRDNPAELATRQALVTLMRHGWGADNPAFRQSFTSLFIPDGTQEQARWFNELQRMTTSPENAVRLQEVFGSVQVEALLPQVRVPTLVLHCTGDEVVPFEEGCRLAMGIRNARFVPLEGRNHILLEDEPAWTRFLAEMHAFLDGADGA